MQYLTEKKFTKCRVSEQNDYSKILFSEKNWIHLHFVPHSVRLERKKQGCESIPSPNKGLPVIMVMAKDGRKKISKTGVPHFLFDRKSSFGYKNYNVGFIKSFHIVLSYTIDEYKKYTQSSWNGCEITWLWSVVEVLMYQYIK